VIRKDEGRFGAKHVGVKLNDVIASAVRAKAQSGGVSCALAEELAREMKTGMRDIGVTMDLLEIRMERCQLGLFGYGSGKKIVKSLDAVPEYLKRAIVKALTDGRLPCSEAWRIAREHETARADVAAACESLGIKVCACQLGAF